MRPVKLLTNQSTLAPMMSYEDMSSLETLMSGDEKHQLAADLDANVPSTSTIAAFDAET